MAEPKVSAGKMQGNVEEERWYFSDQREFLLRSIADAQAEHEAGDLSDEDFSLLVARDRSRLVEVEAELERLAPSPQERAESESVELAGSGSGPGSGPGTRSGSGRKAPTENAPKMSRWRLAGILASCALIVTGVVILVDHALSQRLPGQSSSGSVIQTEAQHIEEQLEHATTLDNDGKYAQSLAAYQQVLAEDPSDPRALAESGWLEWNAGASTGVKSLEASGLTAEDKAIKSAPTFYESHLYLGLILLYQFNNPKEAVTQFNDFLSDSPPAAEVQAAASKMRDAYKAVDLPVPAVLNTESG